MCLSESRLGGMSWLPGGSEHDLDKGPVLESVVSPAQEESPAFLSGVGLSKDVCLNSKS